MNKSILIIPDIHGRTFWKVAIDSGEYGKVIFLGDYVDVVGRISSGKLTVYPKVIGALGNIGDVGDLSHHCALDLV